ncbi:DNA-3-methyladenine glycosylase I [Flaviflexus ciconiae]|uniref:DNA-3-methyladenine glycosylase I n=1 Tax=Flaviflexus ciconiae TaxID=2496867 RepID=UPI00389909C2
MVVQAEQSSDLRRDQYSSANPRIDDISKGPQVSRFLHVGPVTMYALMQAVGIVNDHPKGRGGVR